jgi:uncharacterized protein (TIGR03083 family)
VPHFATVDTAAHLRALHVEGDALAAAAAYGLDATVPSRPGWDVAELIGHTGRVHRWVTAVVRSRTQEAMRLRDFTEVPPPREQRMAWYGDGVQQLHAALDDADLDADIWTWTGHRPARFWARRMAQETVVHRWDGENAHSRALPIDTALAVDGVDEMFDVFVPHHPGCSGLRGSGETLHLHCTDADGEWLLHFTGDGVGLTRSHAKGDAAVRGSASDLLLLLWGRRRVDGLEVFGDQAVVRLWTDVVKI